MKAKYLALMIGACFSHNLWAANNITIEQRLAELEQRVVNAEKRASDAEAQIRSLKQQQVAATPTVNVQSAEPIAAGETPPKLTLSGFSDIKFYGDVEFNMDAASRSGSLTSTRTSANKDWAPGTNERWDINGRLLLGFDGYQRRDNGNFAGFSVQPLADLTGKMNLDDAVFFFGRENDWKIKVGRFEAYDMFPLNQDTFVEHSGNTANDLYDDGSGYIYMMKEGRGRSNAGGNFLVSKQLDNWYFELNTLLEDGTSLYNDGNYHGRDMEQQKNVAYLRPVIAWSPTEEFTVSAAMEANVVNNAYGYTDSKGNFVDQSDRTGYGMSMTWNGLKTDPDNGIVVNLNTAYLDANNEKDFTAGINALWKRFELGYIYAHNKIDEFSGVVCDNDCWIDDEGTYSIHTIHASYQFANVMDMENFNIYLGTYYSILDSDGDKKHGDDTDDRYGARVRFKYFF